MRLDSRWRATRYSPPITTIHRVSPRCTAIHCDSRAFTCVHLNAPPCTSLHRAAPQCTLHRCSCASLRTCFHITSTINCPIARFGELPRCPCLAPVRTDVSFPCVHLRSEIFSAGCAAKPHSGLPLVSELLPPCVQYIANCVAIGRLLIAIRVTTSFSAVLHSN